MKRSFLLYTSFLLLFFAQCSKSDVTGNITNPDRRGVGASANEFLSASRYQNVRLEIQYMPGHAPDPAALSNLVSFLERLINKPGGITITQQQIPASGKSTLLLTDITSIENTHRTTYTSGNSLGVYLLYTDAPYNEANTLGLAYRNTSMVVFAKTVQTNSGGLGQPSRTKLESITTQHEFGHLLGLVDLGSPMQVPHKHSTSYHCSNSSCLMYFSTNVMGGVVVSGPVPELDANCRNDLRANGGK